MILYSLHIFTCLNYSARDPHKFAVYQYSALPGICQYIVRWMFEGAEALSWTCAASKARSSHLERAVIVLATIRVMDIRALALCQKL